jgi:cell division protein FtsQ
MSRRRWFVVGTIVLGVGGLAAVTPMALRRMPFFQVRRVELLGVRYRSPEQVIRSLGLRRDQNLFDDTAPIERNAAGLVGVVRATVERRLPGTLRVTLVERSPVALVPGPQAMSVVDCDGRPLPYDPAATGVDLPLVERPDSVLAAVLCAVRAADTALFQSVDGARRSTLGGGAVTLEMGVQRVILRSAPGSDEIRAVGAVRRHLATTGRAYTELDARFAGWVVVRRART